VTVNVSPILGSIALARRLTVTAWAASVWLAWLAALIGCSMPVMVTV